MMIAPTTTTVADANLHFRTRCRARAVLKVCESIPAEHQSPAVAAALADIAALADETLVDNTPAGAVVLR